jgi:hypothetical protein
LIEGGILALTGKAIEEEKKLCNSEQTINEKLILASLQKLGFAATSRIDSTQENHSEGYNPNKMQKGKNHVYREKRVFHFRCANAKHRFRLIQKINRKY